MSEVERHLDDSVPHSDGQEEGPPPSQEVWLAAQLAKFNKGLQAVGLDPVRSFEEQMPSPQVVEDDFVANNTSLTSGPIPGQVEYIDE